MAAARAAVSPTKGYWDYKDTRMKIWILNRSGWRGDDRRPNETPTSRDIGIPLRGAIRLNTVKSRGLMPDFGYTKGIDF